MRRHRSSLGALLHHVHVSGPLSRAALAERMGVNRSTILGLTAELAAAGLVREEPPSGTTGAGRPSFVVLPESRRFWVLAFDVAVDRLTAARVGLGGPVLDRRDVARSRAGADLDTVVRELATMGRELVAAAPADSVAAGVGAAYCGMIRPGDGMVRYGPEMGWVDQAFGAELERALGLGLPVAVGNEAHLGALAEYARGAGAGSPDLIYLHGDVGVGGGILVGGKLLGGESGYGAEVGHMLVNPVGGRPCLCGSAGCLEAETGEHAILAAAGRPEQSGREAVRAVIRDAEAGHLAEAAAMAGIGDWLGIGVANLINLFNPGVVIFGGVLREVYAVAAPEVAARIAQHAMPVSRERAKLRLSGLADDATLLGAADRGFAALLADPLQHDFSS
ncbi:putative ROK-family transcriptional regulator [Actinoplanes missouriensis 431]|uniref:Putative ROK-family transcriptional regulator n=1 Tax=Actinoplanes missouriensis (strain ATCC 14538 / DSM 43046 / CBS 188.64 / JCM 3121 / NBRC 102363 / NCIMB 12654 / NRRL B-3342 / UNCC 431) TaxID=512565 RepID=I0HAD0_ACTM4|nr:ROK family transcriptional regulator [Actinoplanes missouriensis]BAL89967.1 putative ROK-family transcriptional regulator [Actinoplanes missouriensis 431]